MKIKYLTIFIIVTFFTKVAKMEKNKSLLKIDKEKNSDKLKIINNISNLYNPSNPLNTLNSENREEKSFITLLNNYFRRSTINDSDITLSALISFITGVLLFFISSFYIIRNERRNIKEIQILDCYNKSNSSGEVDLDKTGSLHIINGPINVVKEASIENILLSNNDGRIVLIKIYHDRFSILEEDSDLITKWIISNDLNTYVSKSEISINKYFLDSNLLEQIIINDKFPSECEKTCVFNNCGLQQIAYWMKPFFNGPFQMRTDDMYIYAISDTSHLNFNSKTYHFKDNDRRILIKYFIIPYENPMEYTMIGAMRKKLDSFELEPYQTNIIKTESSLFNCFNRKNVFYEIYRLFSSKLSKEELINVINNEGSNVWLTRIIIILIHLTSYYLILYTFTITLGIIPIFGSINSTILLLITCLLTLISYFLLLTTVWLFYRPIIAFILLGIVIILIFSSTLIQEHINQKFEYYEHRDSYNKHKIIAIREDASFLQY